MKKTSIKRRFLVFSVVLFCIVLAGGGTAFVVSMGDIVRASASAELEALIETRRLSLEGQVGKEIALALKMAGSLLIRRHFVEPGNGELAALAFAEIAGYRAAFTGNNVFWINDADKRYYFGDEYVYTLDPADGDSAWYGRTLAQKERYNFNVSYDPGLKKTMLWINVQVFEGDGGGPVTGIVGTGIDLTDFINALYGGLDDSLEGGGFNFAASSVELYLFNGEGEITGARDSALMEAKTALAGRWPAGGPAVTAAAENLAGNEVKTFTLEGSEYAVAALPLLAWYMTASMPIEASMILQSPMAALFLLMLLVILLVVIIINVFIFRIVRPLDKTVAALREIAGSWDLTRRVEVSSGDEVGNLGEIFNQTFEKIQGLIRVIREKARSLSVTGAEFAQQMSAAAASVGRIAGAVQETRGQTETQARQLAQVGTSTTGIMAHIDNLNGRIAEQSASVSRSSSAIDQMLSNIKAVADTLARNETNVHVLTESSQTSRQELQTVSAEFQEIARQSEGLLEINAVMETIASQTNLLSMNAAIEAAHAGEAGKGFAVVAGEIRKLAEDSGRQSKTTAEVLKKIKASIDTVTASTTQVLDRFEAIAGNVRTVAEQEREIRHAMEEQEAGSRQILEAVGLLRDLSETVRREAEDIAGEGRETLRESKSLEAITAELENSMGGMAVGAEEIDAAVRRVNEISGGNKDSIDTLSAEVMKFKV